MATPTSTDRTHADPATPLVVAPQRTAKRPKRAPPPTAGLLLLAYDVRPFEHREFAQLTLERIVAPAAHWPGFVQAKLLGDCHDPRKLVVHLEWSTEAACKAYATGFEPPRLPIKTTYLGMRSFHITEATPRKRQRHATTTHL